MNKTELYQRLEALQKVIKEAFVLTFFGGDALQGAGWTHKSLQLINEILQDLSKE